ncbi:hypothetical protein LXL04_037355 [Taraxacum kok-saghyz]
MAFAIGDRVEVSGTTFGFDRAFFAATVRAIGEETLDVEMELPLGPDFSCFRSVIDRNRVRACPDEFESVIAVGDEVDVWLGGGWWWGICKKVAADSYTVNIDFMEPWCSRVAYRKVDVRRHQNWVGWNCVSHWMYRQNIVDIFAPGNRVEVMGSTGYYANAFLSAIVVGTSSNGIGVHYEDLYDSIGLNITEVIPYEQVCPYPERSNAELKISDSVEYWDGEVWRVGLCVDVGYNYYVVHYKDDAGNHISNVYVKKNVRRSQIWKKIDGLSCWMYVK